MWILTNRNPRRYHHDHKHYDPHDPHHRHTHEVVTQKSGTRKIKVIRQASHANVTMADRMRANFAKNKVFTLNMVSSQGSGKTIILQKTLSRIMPDLKCALVVGDICTSTDSERLAESGASIIRINTDVFGGDYHLAAHSVEKAVVYMDLNAIDLLIVENIGNLARPAEFGIGEDKRVVVLSVTEGEEKAVKYSSSFKACDATLINKVDLLPYLDLDMDMVRSSIESIHPGMPIFDISAKTETGFDAWVKWLVDQVKKKLK